MDKSFSYESLTPVVQAGVVFVGVVAVILISFLIKITDILYVSELFPWMTATAFMLFFAVFNSILSLLAKDINQYWGRSIMCFLGLAAVSGFLAYLVSGIPIGQAGSYKWLYVVVTFGYLIFLSMMAFMRTIVTFAMKEEWTQPRIRKKRRRK